jgi:hypothetical protein
VTAVFATAVALALLMTFMGVGPIRIWIIPPLALAFLLMWFGLEIGRWLAFLILILASTLALFAASFQLTEHGVRAALFFAVFLAYSAGAAVLLFAEAASDFLSARFGRSAQAADWTGIIAPLLVGRRASARLPQPVDSGGAALAAAAARKRARFGRKVAMGILCVVLGGVLLMFVGIGEAVDFLIEETAELRRQTKANVDSEVAGTSGFFEKLFILLFAGIIYGLASAFATIFITLLAALAVPATYFAFFVAPFLLSLPLSLPFAIRWRDPARVLLLRPFNRQEITGALSKFVTRNVSGFGHVYTLADVTLRVPLYVRVPLVLGQVALFSFRLQRVRTPHNVFLVSRAMRRRVLRNLNWLFSRDKIFAVACTDDAWQAAVTRFAFESDLILIDLSGAKENIVWEVRQCEALGILDRVLLLTRGAELQATRRLLSSIGKSAPPADQLLVYDDDDPQVSARTSDKVALMLIASRKAATPAPALLPGPLDDPARRSQLKVTLVSLAVVALGAAVLYFVNRPGPLLPFARDLKISSVHYDSRLEVRGQRDLVVSRDEKGNVHIVDLQSGVTETHKAGAYKHSPAVVSADGGRLAYMEDEHLVTVRDLARGATSSVRMPGAPFSRVTLLEFSSDGKLLAIASSPGKIAFWRPGEVSARPMTDKGPNDDLLFSPDDTLLLAADRFGKVELWSLGANPSLRCGWEGNHEAGAIAWSRDGTRIATGGKSVEVRDARTCDVVHTVPDIRNRVKSVAFSPTGGDLIWTSGFDTTYYSRGRKPSSFAHPDSATYGPGQAWVFRIAVSARGGSFYGVSTEGGVIVWDLPSGTTK